MMLLDKISMVLVYDASSLEENQKKNPLSYTIRNVKDLVLYESYILLVLDYFAMYVPRMWLERFHYLRNMNDKRWGASTSSSVSTENHLLHTVDLTQDLHQCLVKMERMVDFSLLPECLFHVIQGSCWTFITMKQRRVIRFLMPLIEFLAPHTSEVEYWREKSQGSTFLLSDMDL